MSLYSSLLGRVSVSAVAAGLALVWVGTSEAQSSGIQQPPAANQAAAKPAAGQAPAGQATAGQTAQSAAKPKPVDASRFRPPANANTDQLVDFLADMITFMPETKEAAELFQKIAPDQMTAAAQQVIKFERDKTSDNFKFASKYLMAIEAMMIEKAKPERRKQFVAQVAAILQSPEMDADDLDIAVTLAEGLEIAGDKKLATEAYTQYANILSRSKDPLALELSKLMAGAARRLNLLGNPIQVVGTTVAGKPFNWNDYKGRVVLIDFWATWCGPCLREMPNIQKMYEAYHDKGFEVVGVSMDEDRTRLDEFITKNPMPWVTLHDKEGLNPTAIHYGISALPSTLLIDQQGNVISMSARGAELEAQLGKLLGPVASKPSSDRR